MPTTAAQTTTACVDLRVSLLSTLSVFQDIENFFFVCHVISKKEQRSTRFSYLPSLIVLIANFEVSKSHSRPRDYFVNLALEWILFSTFCFVFNPSIIIISVVFMYEMRH